MRKMTFIFLCFPIFILGGSISQSLAALAHDVHPKYIITGETIEFRTTAPPNDVCSHYGRHFIFDATTSKGQNLLKMILMARAYDMKLKVWYMPSKTPGKDQNTGCAKKTMARVTALGTMD